jgi:PIN domain nuclease of toxin-antitoxin system
LILNILFFWASLKKSTKHLGLSLEDRACVSLGIKLGIAIYTADKIWAELKLENADIRLIR